MIKRLIRESFQRATQRGRYRAGESGREWGRTVLATVLTPNPGDACYGRSADYRVRRKETNRGLGKIHKRIAAA